MIKNQSNLPENISCWMLHPVADVISNPRKSVGSLQLPMPSVDIIRMFWAIYICQTRSRVWITENRKQFQYF